MFWNIMALGTGFIHQKKMASNFDYPLQCCVVYFYYKKFPKVFQIFKKEIVYNNLEQIKEIHQNWNGLENCDNFFCAMIDCYNKHFVSRSMCGH